MLPAIHFDHKLPFGTEEVDDVRTDRCLSPESQPFQATIANVLPIDNAVDLMTAILEKQGRKPLQSAARLRESWQVVQPVFAPDFTWAM